MDILKSAGTRVKGDTLITFPDVPSAIRGEKILKQNGYPTRLVAPPPKFRLGCDLGLEILLSQQQDIVRLFSEHSVDYSRIISLD
jgi:hypothetical protein